MGAGAKTMAAADGRGDVGHPAEAYCIELTAPACTSEMLLSLQDAVSSGGKADIDQQLLVSS